MKEALVKLVDLKSILTIIFVIYFGLLLSGLWDPAEDLRTLFASIFTAIFTYYFTKKSNESQEAVPADELSEIYIEEDHRD